MEFSRPEYWSEWSFPSPGDLPNPGVEPRSPTLHPVSLPAEPQGKPKNTGVGILSLLQQIFLTQELNRGLLHCRQILYQLSYEGSANGHFLLSVITLRHSFFKTKPVYRCLQVKLCKKIICVNLQKDQNIRN